MPTVDPCAIPYSAMIGLILLLCAGVAMSQQFSSLEERMTGSEFKSAGLDKSSPEQLASLNAWLRQDRASAPVAAVAQPQVDRRGFPQSTRDQGPDEDIVSRIMGEVTGLANQQRITLENGQVWQITDTARSLGGVKLVNPTVTIKHGKISGGYLSVSGYNAQFRVKRLQ